MAVWITVDVDLWKHPKMAALPSDSARWGWLVVLSEAKQQKHPGTFANDRHFKEVVGRFGRFLPDYLEASLLETADDGSLQVHDWKQHQWAVQKQRQREDIEETSSGQKEDASRAVPVPVYVRNVTGGESVREGEADAVVAYYNLTARFPRDRVKSWLEEMASTFGHAEVTAAMASEWSVEANLVNFLSRTRNRLEQEAHEQRKRREARQKERAAEERRLIESMPQEQREANMARLRGELQKSGLI